MKKEKEQPMPNMTKQEQFLWIVQTAILANGINLATTTATRKKYKAEFSATGVLVTADDAVRASELIPAKLTAFQAANEFCTYMFLNLRESEDKTRPRNHLKVPGWFSRP